MKFKKPLTYKTYFCDLQNTLQIEEHICKIYMEKSVNSCKRKKCNIKKYKAVLEFYYDKNCKKSNVCYVGKYTTSSVLYKCEYFRNGFCTNIHYNQIDMFKDSKVKLPNLFFCGNGFIKEKHKAGNYGS